MKTILTPRFITNTSGDFSYEFESLLVLFLKSLGNELILHSPDSHEILIMDSSDLLVLPGGDTPGDNIARDKFENSLIRQALELDMKILCICRGAQLVNIFFGGTLEKIEGHINKKRDLDHEIGNFGTCFHNYSISKLGSNLVPKAIDRLDGSIEVFESLNSNILGIISHPERGEFPLVLEEIKKWSRRK